MSVYQKQYRRGNSESTFSTNNISTIPELVAILTRPVKKYANTSENHADDK